jgi:hypothetical protein
LLEKRVVFITGTDEHGEKIATSAEACGRKPKEHCDTISNSYKLLWADVCPPNQVSLCNTVHHRLNGLTHALQILAAGHRV